MSANAQMVHLPDGEAQPPLTSDERLRATSFRIVARPERREPVDSSAPVPSEGTFSERLVRCAGRLQRLARRLSTCPANADDLVQETLLHALEHADSFTPDSTDHLYRWLSAILKNLCCDRYRARRRELLTGSFESHPSAELDPPVSMWRTLNDDAVEAAVRTLSPALDETYRLFVSGLPYEAIAARLAIPISTVGVRIYRARKQLRSVLTAAAAKGQR